MLLKDRVAVVTGSSRGIGAAIAKSFAKEGCTVVVNYNKSKDLAKRVLNEIKFYSRDSIMKRFDVSKRAEVDEAFKSVAKKFKRIDILVNNAGILKNCNILAIENRDLNEILNINLKGYFYCLQSAVRYMIKQNYGRIINISSISQFSPFYNSAHYAMSKGAIKMLTRCAALELSKYNIKVNSIVPGIIKTGVDKKYENKELMAKMKNKIPLDRIGVPEDVVGSAIFLASNLSDYITGIDILVDGGFSLFKDKN